MIVYLNSLDYDHIRIYGIDLRLGQSCIFKICFEDAQDNEVRTEWLTLDGYSDRYNYLDWGADDNYIKEFILSSLGLEELV